MPHLLRRARVRRHSLLSTAAFVVALVGLPSAVGWGDRIIAAWDISAVTFLAVAWPMMARAQPERMRMRARLQDADRWGFLALTVGAACMGLVATTLSLHDTHGLAGAAAAAYVALAAATILAAWGVIHTAFALHYAHIYYGDGSKGGDRGGLAFPGEQEPDYWDFMYFATAIGMGGEVSDVAVKSRTMRRVVMAHGILSFFFNTVILATTISMVAGSL